MVLGKVRYALSFMVCSVEIRELGLGIRGVRARTIAVEVASIRDVSYNRPDDLLMARPQRALGVKGIIFGPQEMPRAYAMVSELTLLEYSKPGASGQAKAASGEALIALLYGLAILSCMEYIRIWLDIAQFLHQSSIGFGLNVQKMLSNRRFAYRSRGVSADIKYRSPFTVSEEGLKYHVDRFG